MRDQTKDIDANDAKRLKMKRMQALKTSGTDVSEIRNCSVCQTLAPGYFKLYFAVVVGLICQGTSKPIKKSLDRRYLANDADQKASTIINKRASK